MFRVPTRSHQRVLCNHVLSTSHPGLIGSVAICKLFQALLRLPCSKTSSQTRADSIQVDSSPFSVREMLLHALDSSNLLDGISRRLFGD
jgi:hypothetical protein